TGTASVNNGIPAGGMVLSATGTPVATLTGKAAVGNRLRIRFATTTVSYNNADMAITGTGWLLKNGLPNTSNWAGYTFNSERHPRTVLAWNATHLFLFVCDGRCYGIVGMTFHTSSSPPTATSTARGRTTSASRCSTYFPARRPTPIRPTWPPALASTPI
ncbi:MAG: phosphodiester glycosidase family protein, partial [Planctomycetes bacterium]|nr:phosphodiester glycosidase family protein [Planctomycetota bacterium]